MAEVVNLTDKFNSFNERWTPKIVGEVNDNYVLLAKLSGEFIWHRHENEDEMFLVIKGHLTIKLPDREVHLQEGEFFVVPKGTEHLPIAGDETHVMLLEPKATQHTGSLVTERTVTNYQVI